MPLRSSASLDDLQTPALLEALKGSARQLFLWSAFVAISTFALLSMIAPRFQSQSEIAITASGSASSAANANPAAGLDKVMTDLQAPSLLGRVADRMALKSDPEFNRALGPVDGLEATLRSIGIATPDNNKAEDARIVDALRKSIDVRRADNCQAIAVSVTSLNPERAANITNALVETYATGPAEVGSTATRLDIKVLSKAEPMLTPVYPRTIQFSAIAGITALLFGVAWLIMLTALRARRGEGFRWSRGEGQLRSEPLLEEEPLVTEVAAEPKAADTEIQPPSEAPAELTVATAPASTFSDIDRLAAHLRELRPSGGGHRTLMTSETQAIVPYAEAIALAKALAQSGVQTLLLDWSPSGNGFAANAGLDMNPGWNDLLRGTTRFDSIIQRLRGSRVHAIGSGPALSGRGEKIDPNLLNLALDALDEVYDNIIVTARHDEARMLFECIEGRFDAAIAVVSEEEADQLKAAQETQAGDANIFIGFEVADIDVIRFLRSRAVASPIAQRIARATRQPMARSA